MNPARIHNLELIPVENGDYEAMRETVELSVALKRACCGTGTTSLEEQTALFWSNYDELVAHTPDTDIRDALRRLVATVQHHLLVFNYLAWATFTPGCPDMATLSAISVCLLCTIRSPFLSLSLTDATQNCRADMIELFPQLCQEKIQFTAFVDPKLVTFLREQYTLLKTAFKRFRVSVKVCAVQILMHFFPCFTLLCVYRFSNSTLWRRSQRSV